MLPSLRRHTCAPRMQLLQEASVLSSDPVPSIIRTSVSCPISKLSYTRNPDVTLHKFSGRGGGARDPDRAAWRARASLDEGPSVHH